MSLDWGQLVGTALVGTGRRPLPPVPETDPIGLGRLPGEGPEERVLAAAALLGLRRRGGHRPRQWADLPEPAGEDPRPPAPLLAAQSLDLLLGKQVAVVAGPTLVGLWVDACLAAGCRPRWTQLVPLLDLATAQPALRAGVLRVVGPRGTWLAEHREAWSWAVEAAGPADQAGAPPDPSEVLERWELAGREGRVELLAAARDEDPAQGRALLRSTWSTDRAPDRAALLSGLARGLGPDDEPFLEAALDDRSKPVRAEAARLLGHLPGSSRSARLAARALPLVEGKGRLRTRLDVAPMPEPDPELARDVGGREPPPNELPASWWLHQLVQATPLPAWEEHLGREPDVLVGWAVDEPVVLRAWCDAAVAQREPRWSAALFRATQRPDLLAGVPSGEREALLAPTLSDLADGALGWSLAGVGCRWSESFSRAVLARLARIEPEKFPPDLGAAFVPDLHPSALPDLDRLIDRLAEAKRARQSLAGARQAIGLLREFEAQFADPPPPEEPP